jgi:hypothetical protein
VECEEKPLGIYNKQISVSIKKREREIFINEKI